MPVSIWCWPYSPRAFRWTAPTGFPDTGHAAVDTGGFMYDFRPSRKLHLTDKQRRTLANSPLDPVLEDLHCNGILEHKSENLVAAEYAARFDVVGQTLAGTVKVNTTTGVIEPRTKKAVLPCVNVFGIADTDFDQERTIRFLSDVEEGEMVYHLIWHNCTHLVREALAAGGRLLSMNGWEPNGDGIGEWRPDKFNVVLESVFGKPRQRMVLGLDPPVPRAAGQHRFIWMEG